VCVQRRTTSIVRVSPCEWVVFAQAVSLRQRIRVKRKLCADRILSLA
jgi:hypothetical protein